MGVWDAVKVEEDVWASCCRRRLLLSGGFFFKKSGERKKGNQQGVKEKKKGKKCDVRSGSIERLAGQTERVLVLVFRSILCQLDVIFFLTSGSGGALIELT